MTVDEYKLKISRIVKKLGVPVQVRRQARSHDRGIYLLLFSTLRVPLLFDVSISG